MYRNQPSACSTADVSNKKRPLQMLETMDEDTTSRSMMLSVLEEEESDQPAAKHKRHSDAGAWISYPFLQIVALPPQHDLHAYHIVSDASDARNSVWRCVVQTIHCCNAEGVTTADSDLTIYACTDETSLEQEPDSPASQLPSSVHIRKSSVAGRVSAQALCCCLATRKGDTSASDALSHGAAQQCGFSMSVYSELSRKRNGRNPCCAVLCL